MRLGTNAKLIGFALLIAANTAFANEADNYSPSNPVDRFVFQVFESKSLLHEMQFTSQGRLEYIFGKPVEVTDRVHSVLLPEEQKSQKWIVRTLGYPGLSIILSISPDSSVSIQGLRITNPRYALIDGLRIGEPISKFIHVLGENRVRRSQHVANEYVVEDEVLFTTGIAGSDDSAFAVTLKTDKTGHVISAEWRALDTSD